MMTEIFCQSGIDNVKQQFDLRTSLHEAVPEHVHRSSVWLVDL